MSTLLVTYTITTCVAYLYPLYASYKALSATSRRGSTPGAYQWHAGAGKEEAQAAATELSELETWTMYWCVVSLFWLADAWIGWMFQWVSLYAHARLLFMCWLALPQTHGASILYKHYLAPFLAQHEGDIEGLLDMGRTRMVATLSKTFQVIVAIVMSEFRPDPEPEPAPEAAADDAPLPPPASEDASEEPPDYSAVAGRQPDDAPPILPSAPQAVNWLAQLAHTSILPEDSTESAPDQATKHKLLRRLRK